MNRYRRGYPLCKQGTNYVKFKKRRRRSWKVGSAMVKVINILNDDGN